MGFSKPHRPLLFITILAIFLQSSTAANTDYTNFIFKGCAKQNFQDPTGIYSQNLKNLLQSLVSQSSQKNFASTTSGDGQNAIMGLYQCRGDLSTAQCYTCVTKILDMMKKLCGEVIALRVQLSGCYLKYEIVGFKQESGTELLFKVCGSTRASGAGFDELRDSGLAAMVSGVKNGFYTGDYQRVFVLGQCESDLSSGDCGSCLKSGVESVKDECGESISGQVYLQKCFLSYSYYPNGVPTINAGSEVVGTKNHTQRTVAIAVGGVAALGFLVVFLMFVRSILKKRKGKHDGWN
ncbi:plasmodesmata-located protein 1 [Mercurialis annua]|uniref:plasmodesmata-located protein 1 n=1 Tax=Mercurialis annua TaxID=3986 RepID=UPI00215F27A2|nr:plasmodesmata-located protein 1 [Mercurialis annua]